MARKDGWSAVYISLPTGLKTKIDEAAKNEDRTVAKWIERVLTEHFAKAEQCDSNTSSPDTPSASSE